jgi:hypothetical protein
MPTRQMARQVLVSRAQTNPAAQGQDWPETPFPGTSQLVVRSATSTQACPEAQAVGSSSVQLSAGAHTGTTSGSCAVAVSKRRRGVHQEPVVQPCPKQQ